jgi:hypothetical protein
METVMCELLDLFYENRISKDLCAEQEGRLSAEIEAVRAQAGDEARQESLRNELVERSEQVARILRDLDIGSVWEADDEAGRRVLMEELLDAVTVFPGPPGGHGRWRSSPQLREKVESVPTFGLGDPGGRACVLPTKAARPTRE